MKTTNDTAKFLRWYLPSMLYELLMLFLARMISTLRARFDLL